MVLSNQLHDSYYFAKSHLLYYVLQQHVHEQNRYGYIFLLFVLPLIHYVKIFQQFIQLCFQIEDYTHRNAQVISCKHFNNILIMTRAKQIKNAIYILLKILQIPYTVMCSFNIA